MAGPVNYIEKGLGLHRAVVDAGYRIWTADGRVLADDPVAVQAIIDAFDPLPGLKAEKLERLKEAVQARADMFSLMDTGRATNVTSAQFSGFWAAAINRYRTLKAAIAAAPDVATLNAINLGTGWPANP